MRILIILLLLSVQGYAQQITESHVTIKVMNPYALTATQVPIGIPDAPVIDQAPILVTHFRDSLMIDGHMDSDWWFMKNFYDDRDDPEYRKAIILMCKEEKLISKEYHERDDSR